MNKHSILIALILISVSFLYSCKSQEEKDEDIILDYLKKNKLEAQKHSSGLYYIIEDEGEGETPLTTDNIEIKYKGYLIDGTVFDQTQNNSTVEFNLSRLILGWQYGIPLIKEGGKETLFIPSELGYGSQRAGTIPANSVLIFEIELVSINSSK